MLFDWLWYGVGDLLDNLRSISGLEEPHQLLNTLIAALIGTIVGGILERHGTGPKPAAPEQPVPELPAVLVERMAKAEESLAAAKADVARQVAAGVGAPQPMPDGTTLPLPSPSMALGLCKHRRSIFPKDCDASLKDRCPRSVLEAMIEAANWAPTHGITEPWRFVICQGEAIDKINDVKVAHAKATLEGDKLHKQLEKLVCNKPRRHNLCSVGVWAAFAPMKPEGWSCGAGGEAAAAEQLRRADRRLPQARREEERRSHAGVGGQGHTAAC